MEKVTGAETPVTFFAGRKRSDDGRTVTVSSFEEAYSARLPMGSQGLSRMGSASKAFF